MITRRLASIDVIRAMTMYLMVFVNDLWTDRGIPVWLEHAPAKVDGMGFADVIFPGFLFIVGLSIPYGMESRQARGQSAPFIFRHIVSRSIALIVMGFFLVNMETYSRAALLPRSVWAILIVVSFFLIWLDYPREKRKLYGWLQSLGIVILILMALLYKDSLGGDNLVGMSPHWWGILGLIGWAYFSCATILLLAGERLLVLSLCLLFFIFFNSSELLHWAAFQPLRNFVGILHLGNASNASITMIGVIAAVVYRKYSANGVRLLSTLSAIVVILFIFGFFTRPLWGISKIRATPSWTSICAAISIIAFIVLIILVDCRGKQNWFRIIKPAGTSTLTCYLLPYFHEAIFLSLIGIRLPLFIRTGPLGIIKSLIFALLIVMVTGLLEKRRIRLKI